MILGLKSLILANIGNHAINGVVIKIYIKWALALI